ncbi:MAG: lipoyl synthase [Chloroflexi bacterium]|nr:lipoyl synthase [Chloroflexota bacterium]
MAETQPLSSKRLPPWFKVRFPAGENYSRIKGLLRSHKLNTVCEEARCPNIGECFNHGTATFMILGDTCTRSCGFCAVNSGRPGPLDEAEPERIATMVKALRLSYVVITSVNRDDLPDGGASVFAACIRRIREASPESRVEVLIPDLLGDWDALATIVEARPAVLNHNIETVPRLYLRVRPKAVYARSLELLAEVKRLAPAMTAKSGLMVGLGETWEELLATMEDLRRVDCDLLTIGQYLRPSPKHLPIDRFYTPKEFADLGEVGHRMGFRHVESGPLVRSSYHASQQAQERYDTI